MLSALKRILINIFKFIFPKRKVHKVERSNSKISSTQEASLGLIVNMYNDLTMYNITLNDNNNNKNSKKINKIKELDKLKNQLEYYIMEREINEVQEIKSL